MKKWLNIRNPGMIDILFYIAISLVGVCNLNHTWAYAFVLFSYAVVWFVRLPQYKGRFKLFIFFSSLFILFAAFYQVFHIILS